MHLPILLGPFLDLKLSQDLNCSQHRVVSPSNPCDCMVVSIKLSQELLSHKSSKVTTTKKYLINNLQSFTPLAFSYTFQIYICNIPTNKESFIKPKIVFNYDSTVYKIMYFNHHSMVLVLSLTSLIQPPYV